MAGLLGMAGGMWTGVHGMGCRWGKDGGGVRWDGQSSSLLPSSQTSYWNLPMANIRLILTLLCAVLWCAVDGTGTEWDDMGCKVWDGIWLKTDMGLE